MKKISLLLVLLVILIAATASVQAAPPLPDYRPIDVGPELREWDPTVDHINGSHDGLDTAAAIAAAVGTPYSDCILDAKWWLSLDDYTGFYFWDVFYLVAESSGAELWVQDDLSWPAGDPRPTPVVTCEQATYLLDEFDNNMYPTETAFFGEPDFHDGTNQLLDPDPNYYYNEAGRQVVLVSNVRDDNYYDPTYPNYIAGFYSPTFEFYFDRNIMSIDAYDWANRVGPDGSRPYLYEGVFAHEYQHLLHDDYDPAEQSWVNEGLSDWAEWLVGYGVPTGHTNAFASNPENSLVLWGDQGGREILTDYGLAYMFQEYMYQKYGADFIQAEFLNTQQGIEGVNAVLASLGATETFADSYHAFATAVYTKGSFTNPELTDFQVVVKNNPEAYDTPGAPPWGSDYIYLGKNVSGTHRFKFNGIDFNPMAWTSDGDTLYGGSGDEVDNFLIAEANLTDVTGATLTFDTYFDIEFGWDYGFVQVSTDGGYTWTSLTNADTCTDLASGAYPTVVANVPGFSGTSGLSCAQDHDPVWITTSFDLSAYDGQQILVGFRYVTDWSYNDFGWLIDNIDIAGVFTSDGSSTEGFKDLNQVLGLTNEYTVQLIGERKGTYQVKTILSGDYVSDWADIHEMFRTHKDIVMVVTYDAAPGVSTYADYTYEMYQGNRNGQFK